jgi:hypothetical protein
MNIKKIIPAVALSGAALALTACGSNPANSSGSLAKFCQDQESVGASMEYRLDTDAPPSADDYKAVEGTLRKLAADAPATVRSDVVTMANAAHQASSTGTGFLDSSEMSVISDRINSFISDNCP